MAEAKRKRARATHHPLVGIFTRSKSQIYLHRNRSGCSWSDSFRSQSDSNSQKPTTRDLIPHSSVLVKDLRTRRIFSHGCGFDEEEEENTCEKRFGISETGFSEEAKSDKDGSVSDDLEKNGSPKMEFVSMIKMNLNGIDEKDTGSSGEGFSANFDKRNKPLLDPRSRMKLFKAPGSFSYRRLLPYLMEVSKDYTCVPKLDQSPKIQKGLEEKPILSSDGQEILFNTSKIEYNNVEYVNESNSASIECIKESSISFDSQKELCMSKDQSLASISASDNSDDAKLMNNRETEDSCCTQNMNNSNGLSLIIEKRDDKVNETDQCSEGTMRSKTGEAYTSDVREYSKVTDLYYTNSDMSDKKPNDGLSNSGQTGGDHCEFLNHGDQSNKEYVLTTPPDADIFGKPEVAENGGNSIQSILSTTDHDFWKPMDVSINRNNSCRGDKSIDSSPRRKWVLNRCSRLKLFKVPGSMSYRRMLPFLLDVTKDNSCSFGKDHHLKLEKCVEEKPTLPSSVSDSQEMPIENCDVDDCHTEHDMRNCFAPPITKSTASLNDQESYPSYDHVNEFPKQLSQQERDVHFEQEMSDSERMMDINYGSNLPTSSLPSLLGPGSLSREDAKFVSNELSVHTREDHTQSVIKVTNGEKQIETDSLHRDSSYLESSLRLDIPTTALKKGILKRTPRGCRGLCTCLNCSSFRLNAERAFEFSSNQMQDAEEVALDLMKELSYMRNMLEKSALGAEGSAVVCINQVKEACRRASEAEELAQNRVNQMNFDLKAHCRMTCAQRPRVRFANRVEEQAIITYSDLPSK
ncbi:hypothetical protein LWI29_027936 [Acer saccharum]|uniref:Uncharacterized protein n=1 Tax=Acer saccharum TaxID=4024 RepID=A0AA39TVL5_ACESA|nr:hypothetical protein LWI29_027936 [Acer saccharum]